MLNWVQFWQGGYLCMEGHPSIFGGYPLRPFDSPRTRAIGTLSKRKSLEVWVFHRRDSAQCFSRQERIRITRHLLQPLAISYPYLAGGRVLRVFPSFNGRRHMYFPVGLSPSVF